MSSHAEPAEPDPGLAAGITETTPLMGPRSHGPQSPEDLRDLEAQKPRAKARYARLSIREGVMNKMRSLAAVTNPKSWDKKIFWERAVMDPLRCLPAVIVGLLLNVLDALSYGEWLPRCVLSCLLTIFKA
jgi:SulP family sulfate permease